MEVKKLCQICMKKIARFTCKMCGSLVCEDCYKDGMCKNCMRNIKK